MWGLLVQLDVEAHHVGGTVALPQSGDGAVEVVAVRLTRCGEKPLGRSSEQILDAQYCVFTTFGGQDGRDRRAQLSRRSRPACPVQVRARCVSIRCRDFTEGVLRGSGDRAEGTQLFGAQYAKVQGRPPMHTHRSAAGVLTTLPAEAVRPCGEKASAKLPTLRALRTLSPDGPGLRLLKTMHAPTLITSTHDLRLGRAWLQKAKRKPHLRQSVLTCSRSPRPTNFLQ
jgi:hypothetical protein